MFVAAEVELVEERGGMFSNFEGSLRSSCQIANGDILMRDARSVSQKRRQCEGTH